MENETNETKNNVVLNTEAKVAKRVVPAFDVNSKIEFMLGKKIEAKN